MSKLDIKVIWGVRLLDENNHAGFCIKIDFNKNSNDPSRVFRAMTGLIESFKEFDTDIIASIDSKIEPIILLEDIESGSLKTWLVNRIEGMDDKVLASGDYKKIIGLYLVKAKYIVVDFLSTRTKITNRKEIETLQNDLLNIAAETNVLSFPSYAPVNRTKILHGIENITNALSELSSEDKAELQAINMKVPFNIDFQFAPEEIEDLLTKEITIGESTLILKIKKPDYLGESMWEFKHGNIPINAKILDVDWLTRFQNREIDVRPSDSLKVRVKTEMRYDYDHKLISTRHSILTIFEVLFNTSPSQDEISFDNDLGEDNVM